MAQVLEVALRRMEQNQPWGFRLRGGTDQGIPLHVEHVAPNGRAAGAGLQVGDYILAICRNNVTGHTHPAVKSEMLRAGNELDLTVQRGEAQAGAAPVPVQPAGPAPGSVFARGPQTASPRSEVCEEHIPKLGGPTFKQVTPKTYQILQDELPASEAGMGERPSSIFNRNKGERSGYLKAKGPTIQKAYGES